MTIYRVTVDIIDDDGTTVLASDVPYTGGNYSDEDSDAGAFSLTLPDSGTVAASAAPLCTEGRYLRFYVNGTVDRTGLIEKPESVIRDVNPANRIRTVKGRDHLAEFADHVVDPPNGLGWRPLVTTVRFDWSHPALNTSGWSTPVYLAPVFTADIDPFGNPLSPPAVPFKYGVTPDGWPDVFTGWIWSEARNGSNSHPVDQPCYFALDLTLTEGKTFVPVFTADDYGSLAVDGAVLDNGSEPPAVQWTKCTASGIPKVSGGVHKIRIKAINSGVYGASDNPGAIAFIAYSDIINVELKYVNVIARTGSQVNSGNPITGGNWKCLNRPANPPGFTPGHAFRLLFQQAQAQGALPGWTLGFSDSVDSNGNAWATTDALTAKVNDETLLDVIRNWAAQGFWDVAAAPGQRVLRAYRWRERGNFHTGATSLTWDDDHIQTLTVKGTR